MIKTLLHVGCGEQSYEVLPPLDWQREWRQVRVDLDPAVKPDVLASIVDLAGIEDSSVECVFSKHNIEHLETHQVPECLASFYRVLKPEGFLIIRTPDLKAVARVILEREVDQTLYVAEVGEKRVPVAALDILYGSSAYIAEGNHFMAHRTGFTASSLKRLLLKAGFEHVAISEKTSTRELMCKAMKRVEGNVLRALESRRG